MLRVGLASVRRFLEGAGAITSFWFAKYCTLNAFYRYALARRYVEVPTTSCTPRKPEIPAFIFFNHDISAVDRCGRFAASIAKTKTGDDFTPLWPHLIRWEGLPKPAGNPEASEATPREK
jgi:hypothetical protein